MNWLIKLWDIIREWLPVAKKIKEEVEDILEEKNEDKG
jgi:hypothetical protein